MFHTDYWMILLLLSLCTLSSSARLLHHRHHRNHTNASQHHSHARYNNTSLHRTVPIRNTGEPLKLTLVNAYPNGFFNPHFNRRWNANANEQRDVEINWNRKPTAVTSTATPTTTTILCTTTMRSLRDRSYTKLNAVGRNVCADQRTIATSINTNEMREPCLNSALCNNGFGYPGIKHRVTKQYTHNCCPGWAQVSKSSHGCTKPICKKPCKNGGKCIKPDTCSCPSGFSGRYCELDINKCLEEKPCDQACYNTPGSYYCKCRDGFQLMGDKQSCKKLIGTEQEMNYELQKKIQNSAATMNQLRMRIDNMEHRQHEMNFIKERVNSLNYLVDVLYKCRTQSSIFCPLQS